jgi:hypothetical protein
MRPPIDLSQQIARFRNVKFLKDYCRQADDISKGLPDIPSKIAFWKALTKTVSKGGPRGHIYFRIGTLLLLEGDPAHAISNFRNAYEEDRRFHEPNISPESMSAYRVLCLLRDFLSWISSQPQRHWKSWATHPEFRRVLVNGLFNAYDQSLKPAMFQRMHTQPNFIKAIHDKDLRLFCWENYLLSLRLLEFFDSRPNPLLTHNEATARTVAALLGGALEAVLIDQLRRRRIVPTKMLGQLISQCYSEGVIPEASQLEVFCVLLQYFRNLLHSNAFRKRLFNFNMNNAKTLKIAFDLAFLEVLQKKSRAKMRTSDRGPGTKPAES